MQLCNGMYCDKSDYMLGSVVCVDATSMFGVYLDHPVHGCGLGTPHKPLNLCTTEVPCLLGKVGHVHIWGEFLVLSHLSCVDLQDLQSAFLIREA